MKKIETIGKLMCSKRLYEFHPKKAITRSSICILFYYRVTTCNAILFVPPMLHVIPIIVAVLCGVHTLMHVDWNVRIESFGAIYVHMYGVRVYFHCNMPRTYRAQSMMMCYEFRLLLRPLFLCLLIYIHIFSKIVKFCWKH